jgi:hypothetical protein
MPGTDPGGVGGGAFGDRTPVSLTPNLRPAIDQEDLEPARRVLSEVIADARASRISGFDELSHWSGGHLLPTAEAFGRVVRYLSRVYDRRKGVLASTSAPARRRLRRRSTATEALGLQRPGAGGCAPACSVIARSTRWRWLPFEMAEGDIHDYLSNKALTRARSIEPVELHRSMPWLGRSFGRRSAWPGFVAWKCGDARR